MRHDKDFGTGPAALAQAWQKDPLAPIVANSSGRRRKARQALAAALLLAPLSPLLGAEAPRAWLDPHPLRLEAITEGRDFIYNAEGFLHRFSYWHLANFPAPGQDGLYLSGGSITGDELFLDLNLQKTLHFDDPRYAVVARVQRREDYDGRFDRFLLGASARVAGDWEAALAADVTGDKGRTDLQYELTWRPEPGRFLRLALVQPDFFYNDKSASDNSYEEEPLSAFIHLRQPILNGGALELALNASPEAIFSNQEMGYRVEAEQWRLHSSLALPLGDRLRSRLLLQLERAERGFSPLEGEASGSRNDFDREMEHFLWSMEAPTLPWSPRFGLRYFQLDENGWFGDELASNGLTGHREWGLYAGVVWGEAGEQWWEPTLHLAQAEHLRAFEEIPEENRDEDRFIAKLNLPWRWMVDRDSGAVLTLNATFRLHEFGFGGGNIQLHWPF